jgi:enoyl-CoA hydratase/carnithine racemase
MSDAATYERDGHVATITYNRPDSLNAVNGDMRECLNAAWLSFRDDDDAWVAIVTGAGRAFCAGADLKDGAGSTGTFAGSFWEMPTVNSFESGLELWKPTIAAVNGPCVGYGLTAAMATDFLIASDRASFAMPEVLLGVPTIVGSIRAGQKLAWSDALELLLTGDTFTAEAAKEMGLAWRVVPHDDLLAEARTLADRLCQGAPLAVRAVKEMAKRGQELPWTEAVRMGETMRRLVAQTNDAKEGGAARREGRPPVWTAT